MANRQESHDSKWILLSLIISLLLCGVSVLFLYRSYDSKREIDELNNKIKEQEQIIDELQQEKETAEVIPDEPPVDIEEDVVEEESVEQSINIDELSAGTEVQAEQFDSANIEQYFKAYEIDDAVFARINGKSYRENNDVQISDLRYLKVLHYDFENKVRVGELIVSAALASEYTSIFMQLFESGYKINSMFLVDDFWTGDPTTTDSNSISRNNTSAFNYRVATGSQNLSKHAFGRAIDINPQQNPYVSYRSGTAKWSHENANDYIDRETGKEHMITKDDLCYKLFLEHGFEWGGDWDVIKDYQHFEKP